MKKRAVDVDDKRAQKKLPEDQLKAINKEVKSEKAKAKLHKSVRPPKKRVRLDSDDNEAEGESDDFGLFARAERKPLNTIDKWQKGHRRAALLAVENKVVEAVTCRTWAEAYENMYEHGWAVVDHFADLLHPACRPDAEQRDCVLDCTLTVVLTSILLCLPFFNDPCYCLSAVPSECLEVIFEGAVFSDCSSFVDAHYDRVNDTARKQMKSVHTGAQTTKWKAHKDRYGMQTAQIIEGFTLYEGQEQVLVAQDKHNTRKRSQGKKTASAATAEDLIDATVLECLEVQQALQLTGKWE
jgi:hypothetical protein